MRDLYKNLDLHPSAPAGKIRQRLEHPAYKRRAGAAPAREILLSEARRPKYDRVLSAVKMTSFLRDQIGISRVGFGALKIYDDFRRESSSPPAQARDETRVPSRNDVKTATDKTDRALYSGLLIIGALVLFLGAHSMGWIAPTAPESVSVPTERPRTPQWAPNFSSGINEDERGFKQSDRDVVELPKLVRPGAGGNEQLASARSSSESPSSKLRLVASDSADPLADLASYVPLPNTGDFDKGKASDYSIAVKTDRRGHHVFVRIVLLSGRVVSEGFVRAGDEHEFFLPAGTYKLKTASGDKWYGLTRYFGSETRFAKADDTFPLKSRGEKWTVELIRQERGNLTESEIDESDF